MCCMLEQPCSCRAHLSSFATCHEVPPTGRHTAHPQQVTCHEVPPKYGHKAHSQQATCHQVQPKMAETKEADRLKRLLEHDSCLGHLISLSPPHFESHCWSPLNRGTGGGVAAGAGATLCQPLCQGRQLCLTHLFQSSCHGETVFSPARQLFDLLWGQNTAAACTEIMG